MHQSSFRHPYQQSGGLFALPYHPCLAKNQYSCPDLPEEFIVKKTEAEMFSTTLDSSLSTIKRREEAEQIDDSTNPWYFYFHTDQAKAMGRANNQYEFIINRKDIETIWAENIAPPEEVIDGFKINPKVFAKPLVDSSNDPEPIALYSTHNYDWILYDGQFEVQKIKITKNKLKIHTKCTT